MKENELSQQQTAGLSQWRLIFQHTPSHLDAMILERGWWEKHNNESTIRVDKLNE